MLSDKPVRILLVDDSPADRMLFRELLKEIDPTIIYHQAKDGMNAIMQLTAEDTELPDMIFLDVNMPLMNGVETLAAIKKYDHLKDIPVIMFSSGEMDSYSGNAKELGASYCLKKAINMQDNLDEIRIIIERIIVHNRISADK